MDDALRELEPLFELVRTAPACRGRGPRDGPGAPALRRALAAAPMGALALAAARWVGHLRLSEGRRWVGHDLLEAPGGRVSLFLLPAGGAIPLHDHPDMVVLMRVVLGRVRVTSLDRVDRRALLARPGGDRVLTPADGVLEAGPTHGNLHAIEALEASAFVDVLTPDYADDRPCTYFVQRGTPDADGLVGLRPVAPP